MEKSTALGPEDCSPEMTEVLITQVDALTEKAKDLHSLLHYLEDCWQDHGRDFAAGAVEVIIRHNTGLTPDDAKAFTDFLCHRTCSPTRGQP